MGRGVGWDGGCRHSSVASDSLLLPSRTTPRSGKRRRCYSLAGCVGVALGGVGVGLGGWGVVVSLWVCRR